MFVLELKGDGEKIYLYRFGGKGLLISTFSKGSKYSYICDRLSFVLISGFWERYTGLIYKGKMYKMNTKEETAKFIEQALKEN